MSLKNRMDRTPQWLRLGSGCSLLTVTCALSFALPLAAAEATVETNNAQEETIDVILVTATKTGQTKLQDTPIAITALSADDLENSGATNVADLVQITPGLSVSENAGMARIYVRGVGTNLDFVGSDPSTTVHLDGVYVARPQAIFSTFLGVDRVEVLRGPQGTLYGRNSIGGTINVISEMPTEEAFAKARLELGNFDKRSLMLGVGGPLASDVVMGNLFALKSQHDGYVENNSPTGESDLMDEDTWAIKAALRFAFNRNVDLILRTDAAKEDDSGTVYKPTFRNGDGSTPPPLQTLSPDLEDDPHTVNIPVDPQNPGFKNNFKTYNKGNSAELNYTFNNFTLTSLTAYRTQDMDWAADSDWSEIDSRLSMIRERQDQISEELRISSQTALMDWTAGLYYFQEEADFEFNAKLVIPFPAAAGASSTITSDVETEALAAFYQSTFYLSDAFSSTLGIRYSKEEKTFNNSGSLNTVAGTTPLFSLIDETKSWHAWTPKAGLEFRPADTQLLYMSVSEGFKSGGYNASAASPAFDPEKLTAYEFGYKSQWLDRKLSTNLALFFYDYRDMQVQSFQVAEDSSPQVIISNAAEATVKGIELETFWRPSSRVDISFNVAYLDATYDKFITAVANATEGVDASDNYLNSSPRWKTNTALQYHLPVADGEITSRLEWYWQTEEYYTAFNDPVSSQGTYGIINARIGYTKADESWGIALYGKNLDNKEYTNAIQDFSPLGVTKSINAPRTYGIAVTAQL